MTDRTLDAQRREWFAWVDVGQVVDVQEGVTTEAILTRQVPRLGSLAWQEQVLVKFSKGSA